ncbi:MULTISPECIES: ABC transporter substrate-binding protein [Clostridium]|uniref:ABC transporter substrate-binding protein n=1 Tax=Clostridium TaxID=1485 RepID=UPI0008257CB9|nr:MULTISPECIES: ABC transporter substrate-binding protein [Clostridium]PJI09610.1 ferrichrome ABC transporter substrate-binding protein [Clostridium sp. CT7]
MYKKIKILVISLLVLVSLALSSCTPSSTNKTPTANEPSSKKTSASIMNYNGKVYVSLKDAYKCVNGKYSLNGKTANISDPDETLKITSGSDTAYVTSLKTKATTVVKMSTVPTIKNNDMYVPMDFLSDVMDARLDYSNGKLNIETEMPLKYTKAFSIKYLRGGLKKVTDGNNKVLILVPKGKAVPDEYKNDTIVTTPVTNVLCASTTQGTLLKPLNELGSIKSVTSKENEWEIKDIQNGLKNNSITYVGDNNSPDYEKISSSKPDMAFLYGGTYGLNNMMKKFDELKINYASDNEYLEENPLGRLEWIKFLSAFYNKEDTAEKYFNDMVKKVHAITKKTSSLKRPNVAWGIVENGKVYIPEKNSYPAKMIQMAGGNYIFKNFKNESGYITLEDFYAKAKDADILIYASTKKYTPSVKSMLTTAPVLKSIKPVKDKKVWCFSEDYYQSIDKTDELIEDLASILHPDSFKGYTVKHYSHY